MEEVLWVSASNGDFHINFIPGDMEGQCCHIGPESHLKKDYSDSGWGLASSGEALRNAATVSLAIAIPTIEN